MKKATCGLNTLSKRRKYHLTIYTKTFMSKITTTNCTKCSNKILPSHNSPNNHQNNHPNNHRNNRLHNLLITTAQCPMLEKYNHLNHHLNNHQNNHQNNQQNQKRKISI